MASGPPLPGRDQRDFVPGTLGALLYADKAKPRVSEQQWLALIRCIAAGDQSAMHTLYQRAHRIVFTLSVRITNNRETAEEVTLDVFHDVWRRASAYDPAGGSVLGWIMNQTRSRAIDRLRFDRRKKRVDAHTSDPPAPVTAGEPDQALDLKQQGRAVRDALAVLTDDERCAIETAFFGELTYAEVAARLAQPLGTVKTRVRSALEKLRQTLDDGVKEP